MSWVARRHSQKWNRQLRGDVDSRGGPLGPRRHTGRGVAKWGLEGWWGSLRLGREPGTGAGFSRQARSRHIPLPSAFQGHLVVTRECGDSGDSSPPTTLHAIFSTVGKYVLLQTPQNNGSQCAEGFQPSQALFLWTKPITYTDVQPGC